MRKAVLFIAMSLDGYIADSSGGVGWLRGQDPNAEVPDGYAEFSKSIDTVFMGWNTYRQITTELSPSEWIYGGFTTYVFTHNTINSTENIRFTSEDPAGLLQRLKTEPGKNIWVCGGANLIHPLMDGGLIDEFYITVVPTLLGSGIRLFGAVDRETPLRLLRTRTYNGMTDLIYARR